MQLQLHQVKKTHPISQDIKQEVKALSDKMSDGFNSQKELTRSIKSDTASIRSSIARLVIDVSDIKKSTGSIETKLDKIHLLVEKQSQELINQDPTHFNAIVLRLQKELTKQTLKPTENQKTLDQVIRVLASAELIYEYLQNSDQADYSGVIVQYCKAIEILLMEHCRLIEWPLKNEIGRLPVKTLKGGRKVPSIDEKSEIYRRMTDETPSKNPNRSIFYTDKVSRKLVEFLKFGVSGDIYMYNTLLFVYHMNPARHSEIERERIFEIAKDIYILYHNDRNGSAHTNTKTNEDATRIRGRVIGKTIGLTQRILFEY